MLATHISVKQKPSLSPGLSLSLSRSLSLLASHVFLLISEADQLRLRTACVPVGGAEKQGHLEARENWPDKVARWGINRGMNIP
jgi:hypothetical protein